MRVKTKEKIIILDDALKHGISEKEIINAFMDPDKFIFQEKNDLNSIHCYSEISPGDNVHIIYKIYKNRILIFHAQRIIF